MQLRYNYRLYPSSGQRRSLARAFGCARVVFNDALRARQEAHATGHPYIRDGELSARLTAVKATPERAWLGEVSAAMLQNALGDLNTAYRNFFASIAGKRAGPRVAAPTFRSRKDRRQAIRFTRNAPFSITAGGKLRLPKIGDVEVRWSRELPSPPSSVTVIVDATGRYFASAWDSELLTLEMGASRPPRQSLPRATSSAIRLRVRSRADRPVAGNFCRVGCRTNAITGR